MLSFCSVGELSKFFGLAFSALLPLVNPLEDALVFLGLVGSAPPGVYRTLAEDSNQHDPFPAYDRTRRHSRRVTVAAAA
jgi:hypothetical protein